MEAWNIRVDGDGVRSLDDSLQPRHTTPRKQMGPVDHLGGRPCLYWQSSSKASFKTVLALTSVCQLDITRQLMFQQ